MANKFYNALDSQIPRNISYADVIQLIESSSQRLYVDVHYLTGTHDWLPVDKVEYLRQLKMIGNPEIPYPCLFEIEPDGEMFIHQKAKNS